jgi:hypothetical protein
MKKIAAITMARNDSFFLKKWISYYGRELGRENLYVFLDGLDQEVPEGSEGVSITKVEKIKGKVVALDRARLKFLSDRAAELLTDYDLIIGCDADEFLVVDPKLEISLRAYLSTLNIQTSVSGLGLDIGQNLNEEKPIIEDQNFLSQRSYAFASTRYTKPVVIAQPLTWGSGFHRIKGYNFHIAEHLYLIHLGGFDDNMLKARFSDKDRMAGGWAKHIEKRRRTIIEVTERKAIDLDKISKKLRLFQTFCRKPYAWNKPSMAWWKVVVKLPERFKNIL